jgi:phage terminase large subunit-like protein
MAIQTILSVRRNAPVKGVRASRGKITRAEPISSLYEQQRMHHVGGFPALEDQLTTYVAGKTSPDRLDALVWACTELFVEEPDDDDQSVLAFGAASGWGYQSRGRR